MFSTSSVGDAISQAVAVKKAILIFMTDEESESQRWESELLPCVEQEIRDTAVALRLVRDSPDALQFGEIFPVVDYPAVYIVRDGVIADFICSAGISQGRFRERVAHATSKESSASNAQGSELPIEEQRQQKSDSMEDQLEERKRRLKGKQKQSNSTARSRAVETDAKSPANAAYIREQKVKRDREAEEKQRILRLLEDDKAERRARQQRNQTSTHTAECPSPNRVSTAQTPSLNPGPTSETCALAIRLLNGTTIKHRFESHTTISEVREWINNNRTDGDDPFILVKRFPTRSLGVAEESESLRQLELTPSAVLILKPVKGAAAAYEPNTWGSVGWYYVNRLSYGLNTFLGLGQTTDNASESTDGNATPRYVDDVSVNPPTAESSLTKPTKSTTKIRTFRTQALEDEEDLKLYNGNQLDTLPNTDAEDSN